MQRFDVPGTTFETVIGIAEIAPSVAIGRPTQPVARGPGQAGAVCGPRMSVPGSAPVRWPSCMIACPDLNVAT